MTESLLVRRHGQAAWPLTWSARIRGFQEGVAFRLDWVPNAGVAVADEPIPERIAAPQVALERMALIAPDWEGQLLAFSPWAVNEALRAWRALRIRRMESALWFVNWLNEASSSGGVGVHAGIGVRGAVAMALGTTTILFCPPVLGPLGVLRTDGNGFSVGPGRMLELVDGLAGSVEDGHLRVRGAQLADGFWRHGFVKPWSESGGWWRLPIHVSLN
ncbi:hypothetical protein [Sulfobacillus harzensis]|uniref:Uncharacterized protein n=1 Tax=Sulfobacillus harzensis TaxID=2729629 RepID=A0A7Y0Q354_9FIRM|nr:hypothetical protein [Sulfobacillus harzensis]NMP23045.1 hypothetical protein [Sulfobacillus harzensis]